MALAPGADATWQTTIMVLDKKGQPLSDTGSFAGAEMNGGKPATPHVWVNKFTMNRTTMLKLYDDIDHASVIYAC
jgi:uncharacterized lipoprotein NlpE involved in copper resistance